jgi:hypothetical protein
MGSAYKSYLIRDMTFWEGPRSGRGQTAEPAAKLADLPQPILQVRQNIFDGLDPG